jgi:outer membrane protein OmpA-like peptidoglycan-associated protein
VWAAQAVRPRAEQIARAASGAREEPTPLPPDSLHATLVRLQQTAGNAAVSRLIAATRASPRAPGAKREAGSPPAPVAAIQRCPGSGGACGCQQDAACDEDEREHDEFSLLLRAPSERASTRPSRRIHRAPAGGGAANDCPGYEPGEIARSRTGDGILTHDVMPRGRDAMLIGDFGVDRSAVKQETKEDSDLQAWIAVFESDPSYQLSILGLDDCVGAPAKRAALRKRRAESVLALLGPAARARVAVADAAPEGDFTADNQSIGGRAMNRGVLVQFRRVIDMKPTDVEAKPPPRRNAVACNDSEADQLARAHPIAIAMVDKAIAEIPGVGSTSPQAEAVMRKYFKDAGSSTHMHVRAGFLRIREGLKTDFKYECEDDCDKRTVAYVVPIVGMRVHMCKGAFGTGIFDLASTIIHECSHIFDRTNLSDIAGEPYCTGGCPASMDRWDAIDNADSYAEFAEEVYTRL